MSGETESSVSGWTTDTLKVHLESLKGNLEREVILARDALRELLDERDTRYRDYIDMHAHENEMLLARLEQTFSALLSERDKRYSEHFEAAERAVDKAFGNSQTAIDRPSTRRSNATRSPTSSANSCGIRPTRSQRRKPSTRRTPASTRSHGLLGRPSRCAWSRPSKASPT